MGDGVVTVSEDGGTDADDSRTFLNGDFEVMGHAHGEFGKLYIEFCLEFIPEDSEFGKDVVEFQFRCVCGSDGHESADLRGTFWLVCQKVFHIVWHGSVFGFFRRDIDFDKEIRAFVLLCGDALDAFQELRGVHGVDAGCVDDCVADFVLLQMPDDVPLDVLWKDRDFGEEFLDFVFAEHSETRVVCVADGLRIKGFGDGQQLGFVGLSSCLVEGALYFVLDGFDVAVDDVHGSDGCSSVETRHDILKM